MATRVERACEFTDGNDQIRPIIGVDVGNCPKRGSNTGPRDNEFRET